MCEPSSLVSLLIPSVSPQIQQAVEALRDPVQRKAYDDRLRASTKPQSWDEWMSQQRPQWDADYRDWQKQEEERIRANQLRREEGMRARVLRDEYDLWVEEEEEVKAPAAAAPVKRTLDTEHDAEDHSNSAGDDGEEDCENGDDNEEYVTCNDKSHTDDDDTKESSGGSVPTEFDKTHEEEAKEEPEQPVTDSFLRYLVPFFNHKLNSLGPDQYRADDLSKELLGVVLESIQGLLEEWRLSIPGAQQKHTANFATGNGPDHCRHLGPWEKTFNVVLCEACHRPQPLYSVTCPSCGTKACVICKFEVKE
jgi:hypothetical protein